jgi:hypothetical protein
MESIIPISTLAIGLGIAAGFVVSFQTLESGKNLAFNGLTERKRKSTFQIFFLKCPDKLRSCLDAGSMEAPTIEVSSSKRKRGRPPKSKESSGISATCNLEKLTFWNFLFIFRGKQN